MPHNLKRYTGYGDLHFITSSCYQRRHFLHSVRSKNLAAKILSEVRDRYKIALVGYVFMPDHIHLLISEPSSCTPGKVMQVFKHANPVLEKLLEHPWVSGLVLANPKLKGLAMEQLVFSRRREGERPRPRFRNRTWGILPAATVEAEKKRPGYSLRLAAVENPQTSRGRPALHLSRRMARASRPKALIRLDWG